MIRRVLLVAAAAAILILAPSTAAMAYDAPGYTSTVSDPTPTAGVPFTYVVTGAVPNSLYYLRVAGQTLTATANANGVLTFSIVLNKAGTYTLVVTDGAGNVVSTQVVRVHLASNGPGNGGGDDGELSNTGFDSMPLAIGGGALVLAGAGAVVASRRRSTTKVSA